MLNISAAYAVVRCPSFTFVYSVETNKHIFKFFSPSDSHTILVFSTPNAMAIFRREPPNGGVECRWGRQKSQFPTTIWLHRVLSTARPPSVIRSSAGLWQVGDTRRWFKRCCLLFTGYDDDVFMTRSINVIPKTTEQRLIVRSGKCEAEVTNNKRLQSRLLV